MSAEESKKIVLKYFECMNNGDAAGASDQLAEDATWWVIGSIPGISGTKNKKEITDVFKFLLASLGGKTNFIIDHVIAEGNYVALEARADSKTPKGRVYQNRYHFKFEVRDGKILRARAYNDTALIKEVMAEAKES